MKEILEKLEQIQDNRQEWKVKHKLGDVVFIVLMGTIANADDFQEIEAFAQNYEEVLKKYIELPNGVPSHDTIQRVMAMVSPKMLQDLQNLWNEMLSKNEGE